MSNFNIAYLKEKFPPLAVHIIYILFSASFCFLYYLFIVKHADLHSANSINSVLAFESAKPFQFRLLVPLVFKILFLIKFIPQKALLISFSTVIVYLILLVFYYLLCEYFEDKYKSMFFSLFILYPMTWNYVMLNNIFYYYDFTAILLFTLGLYFIIKNNFALLFIVFIMGLINKETIAYLVFAYLLYNYKNIFTRKIFFRASSLALLFLIVKTSLYFIFKSNLGDPLEVCLYGNIKILSNIFTNHIYAKNVFLNFGGLYIFIILLFATGRIKKFYSVSGREKVYINLTIVPFLLLGIFIIYFSEVRVYSELMPMVTILFLIFISTDKKLRFEFVKKEPDEKNR